jgi:DNA replication protein DnaC
VRVDQWLLTGPVSVFWGAYRFLSGHRVRIAVREALAMMVVERRRDLVLESAIAKLDKFHLLILDDIAYVTKNQAETCVLFELISARYERRSMLITTNQPFGAWNTIFPDPAMTLAAVDRLVHHATIFEMNVESYRRKAVEMAKGSGLRQQKNLSGGDHH